MIPTHLIRILRAVGWLALAASVGVVLITIVTQSVRGPIADQVLIPSQRLRGYFLTSIGIAGGATLLSALLALPVAAALVHTSARRIRPVLLAASVMPLVTMPSVFAYAWILLSTRPHGWAASILARAGWFAPAAPPIQAAWVLSTWLWPIPALMLVAAFRYDGLAAYQLARLDASPARAMLRGALPAMRGPLVASLAAVFILGMLDAIVAPLLTAKTWAVEMMADAAVAMRYDRPVGYMFWASWPMLIVIALLVLTAVPGLRRMTGWLAEPHDIGAAGPLRMGILVPAVGVLVLALVFPLASFVFEFGGDRTPIARALAAAMHVYLRQGLGSMLVAFAAGLMALCITLATLPVGRRSLRGRWLIPAAVVALLATAALIPEIVGISLISFYARISDPLRWNVYDNTPWVWIAGLLARFGFLPACIAWILVRRLGPDAVDQARLDGATEMQALARVRLPMMWQPLIGACVLVACLSLTEISTSVLVQTHGFFGGSLAVAVDNLMHYGRNLELVATSLLMLLPAAAGAAVVPWLLKRGRDE